MAKQESVQRRTRQQGRRRWVRAVCLGVMFCFTGQNVLLANPMGGVVVNGQASFNTSGNALTVTNTPGTIINWQGFSINANEITHFAQQSAASAVLNRVVTNTPSAILGTLSSNGQVYLVNPNGIVFGAGSTVNVAGLVATSLNLSDADFMAGRHNYTAIPGAQNVSNAGNITAQQGGQIYLIAPNVENTGIITAPNGEILLAAGYEVQLVNSLDPNLRVSIKAPAGDATNLGKLIVESGSLGLFGTMVRNSGTASADSATLQGGKIVFKASSTTTLDTGSVVSATGTTGGGVMVEGNTVALLGNTSVDVSGINGGGTVLVGGDAHGANPAVQNAQFTYVDSAATIKADAIQNGNGGKVVVWADNATQFGGTIYARGGAQSGNGGWVETSGKQRLGFAGLVDTTAPHGMMGSLLLDPTDITISTALSTGTMAWNAGTFTFSDVATGGVNTSNLNVATLTTQLGLTNVTVSSNGTGVNPGNITVQTPIAWASANSLTLSAVGTGSIVTNAGSTITNTGTGGLTMTTVNGGITLNDAVTLANGAFTATAGGAASTIAINAPVSTGTGAINLTAGASITEGAGGSLATVTDLATGKLGVVTTSSTTGTTLNNATNSIAIFKATNTVSGNITLNNNAPTAPYSGLTLLTTTNTGGGSINVTNVGILCICWNGVTPTVITNNGGGAINLTTTGPSGWIREATGTIVTTGTVTTNNSSASGTSLNGGTNQIGALNATDVGMVYLLNGAALNITGVTASDVLINNTAATTVSGTVTATNAVSMTAAGFTNNSTIRGNLGVSLNAGTGTLTNIAGATITNGGGASTGAISLTADKMVLTSGVAAAGNVIAGAGAVNLGNSTLTNAINLGSTTDATAATLELSNAELATISTTDTLTISSTGNTGLMTVSAPITVTERLALLNGGSIAVNGSVGSAGNVSMLASGATSDITIAAGIVSGNATATPTTVTLNSGRDIIFTSTGGISNGGTATNAVNINLISASVGGTGGIWMKAGSSMNSNGGAISLGGGAVGGYAVADAGSNNSGIYLDGTINSGSGSVTMLGDGGTLGDGVTFGLTSSVNSNGIVNITGKAASAGNLANDLLLFGSGVDFIGNGTTGALLTTATGNVTITGTNNSLNAAPTSARSQGITVEAGATVQTTGSGSLTLNGSTNAASINTAYGLGVMGGTIQSTGGGTITLIGTALNAVGGGGAIIDQLDFNAAPGVFHASKVLSNGGEIRIRGTGFAADSIWVGNGSIVGGATSGNILLQSTNANRIAVAATGSVNAGTNALTFFAAGGQVIDQNAGLFGSIAAGSLRLLGTGTFSLTNPVNNVGTLTANVSGAVSYTDANAFAIGSVTSFDGTAVTTTNGVTTGGSALTAVATTGNITINSGASVNTGAGIATLATSAGNFINNSGSATPITATSARIWSASPSTSVKGGMIPAYSMFNCTYALANCNPPPTGIGFLYAQVTAPTLTIVADALTKVYGATDPALSYVLTGLVGGDTAAIVTGAQTRVAGENAATYAISQGTLSIPVGYGYTLVYSGSNLVISKAPLTVAAIPASKILGTADPLLTYTTSGLQFGETTASVLNGGSLARSPGESVGSYTVNQGSLALLSANYTLNYVPCSFTILAPTIVQEITQISIQAGISNSGTVTGEDKKKASAVAAAEASTDEGGSIIEPLPVCQ